MRTGFAGRRIATAVLVPPPGQRPEAAVSPVVRLIDAPNAGPDTDRDLLDATCLATAVERSP
ncbi:hypothetical protein RM844_20360 [Streptomyces sp. DSM 44915]|uniref:Uncharacterized protein n=1 Tax=Streptomyces chisholmiae TaxID=3075540 RepID=A0ABU2JUR5_9ACTN|nr:hypothetical protein [Streptomyces sp. DSM 44915]MDT0268642.1 hypothetical protein [Streptomyces sp. DSM 44915]